ncbi:CBS domain-containing protein [Nocardioides sp. W7]|uniref:CBS domain-containing protein n=1 Tax=Nocardioides sp. W7 TaxID=2931390 RepID=UPI001FD0F8A0|nr:CBS domain-containing protein [Nocardioides sp. W7]
MLVSGAMTPDPVTVAPEESVKRTLVLLQRHGVTALPVVADDGRLVGVVSEADLIRNAVPHDPRAHLRPSGPDQHQPPQTVAEVLTADPVTVRPHDDLSTAVELMSDRRLKSLPVVDDHGRVVGIIARSDVVRLLARPDGAIAAEIRETLRSAGYADWTVGVSDGVVVITGPGPAERSLAESVAHTVGGVVAVRIG